MDESLLERDMYDLFLSYRWNDDDKELSESLFDIITMGLPIGLSNRSIWVFLDKKRLTKGRNFRHGVHGFAQALINSTVAVPILSADALEKFISADWNADTDDNLLTEWIIMYFCYKHKDKIPQSRLKCIFPILIGSRTNSNANGAVTFVDFFAEGWKDKLPNEVQTGTIAIKSSIIAL